MPHDNQPSALRSLGVGALIGIGGLALVALLAGCDSPPQNTPASRVKAALASPPVPQVAPVILAVESQRSASAATFASTVDDSPTNLTVRTALPVSVAAPVPIQKRGSLSFGWGRIQGAVRYRLYYGTNSGNYHASAIVGNVTNATLTGLDEGTWYFVAATCVDDIGGESNFSNEIAAITPIWIGSPQPFCWTIPAYGMVGRTNQMQVSTNLTTWETIHTWVGNGSAVNVLYTNRVQAWFRVEVRP